VRPRLPRQADQPPRRRRCYGPSENHLPAVAANLRDLAIVNPASALAEGRLRVCGRCHGNHAETTLPRTDPFWIRFQSTSLPWSRCDTESGGAMDCTICHDPHHDKDRSEKHRDTRCLDCHSNRSQAEPRTSARRSPGSASPVNPVDGCVRCHMPTFRNEPLHADFTDHFIRVHPDKKPEARSSVAP
jgi:formate-dependent nitrite reductase cytochrome c552 subunit